MLDLLWLVPALPFAGFVVLVLIGRSLPHRLASLIGTGTVGLSALITIIIGATWLAAPPAGDSFSQTLWIWFSVDNLSPGISLYLDAMALVFTFVVTFVGFLIHLYSVEFMEEDEGYSRFFAYMNLFVGSMLTLVLADNLLLLYLGWEGVGLCSYLLIGFWYREVENGRAARKAFVVTRVGDTAMAIGLFILFAELGTLGIQEAMQAAQAQWGMSTYLPIVVSLLLVGGAVGKSAQIPLQTWLPDAMAGPTPVSALIHAATMVTAGVYLIARTHVLFSLAPEAMLVVAVIGALTLVIAGFSALTQWDIKRVLAYSTISQIGYMFLALGVGAWSAAVFHFFTHAFFKALLFLAAGVVILAMHEEHNMFKMGGLRKPLPVVFWTFVIGAASLASLPLVTAGFYSKDLILADTLSAAQGSVALWLMGLLGAFVTALYSFRMVFVTFFGEQKKHVVYRPGLRIQIPLLALAVLALVAGFVELPRFAGHFQFFAEYLLPVLPETDIPAGRATWEIISGLAAAAVALGGIGAAWFFYVRAPALTAAIAQSGPGRLLHRFFFSGWGFDWLYDHLLVRPYSWLANTNRRDVVDSAYTGLAWGSGLLNRLLSATETGLLRWYAASIALGAILVLAITLAFVVMR